MVPCMLAAGYATAIGPIGFLKTVGALIRSKGDISCNIRYFFVLVLPCGQASNKKHSSY